jgi:16S rRNA (adenine1518-N6/adenine1519-N6)-dimethyltransferase
VSPKELLHRYGLQPKKALGQNFLLDPRALARLAQALGPLEGREVWEVGPGLGGLTRLLADGGARVHAIELDRTLEAPLREVLAGTSVELYFQDALSFDWSSVPAGSLFAANLPYHIATPLLSQVLRSLRFERLVILVQREVAQRLVAQPGSRAYGLLSLRVQHHARVRRLFDLPPSAFYPPPKVTSTAVLLESRGVPDDPLLFFWIERAFIYRRKTLENNLLRAGVDPEVLQSLTLPPGVRAEQLSLDDYRRLAERLGELVAHHREHEENIEPERPHQDLEP